MLTFHNVRWKNFLSTGNQFTEVRLDKSPTTLIIGENGAGKSTILDAICFALFNKPFRDINKPQLMNTINQKGMLVEIEFSVGSKKYKICRGAKPTVFEIYYNGELINQDAAARDYQAYLEDNILKFNYKSFTQIVILGSASFTPFMQLPASHRREIIEDLLDIRIFSTMGDVLKEQVNENKSTLQSIETQLDLKKKEGMLLKNYIATLESNIESKKTDDEQKITEYKQQIETATKQIQKAEKKIAKLTEKIKDKKELKLQYKTVTLDINRISNEIESHSNKLKFYDDNETCPTCSQNINRNDIDYIVTDHNNCIAELKNTQQMQVNVQGTLEAQLDVIEGIEGEITELNQQVTTLNSQVFSIQKVVNDYLKPKNNIFEEDLTVSKAKLKDIAKEVVTLSTQKSTLTEEKHYLNIANILLKDTGIKTKVIDKYLPIINKLVNKYLHAMDFFVSFELDNTFTETIKSRHRDVFSYASFSEGEKQRLDLAILFTWRTIAKLKSSANTNLLILDEIFDSSLDANGTDFVMNLLYTIGEDTNVFIISHKDALFDKFRSVIKFEKFKDFSRIAK